MANKNEYNIKSVGRYLSIPINTRANTYFGDTFTCDNTNPHKTMLSKMVYLVRFKENTQVIKARQIIRARKDKREKTCTSDTEGGLDSELEVSEEEPEDKDDRVSPPKGEKKKRVKSTSRSTATSRESEDDSLELFSSVKNREKISKLENRLFQAYQAYTETKADHPPSTFHLLRC